MVGIRSRQVNPTATFRPDDTRQHCPGFGRRSKLGGGLDAGYRNLALAGLQIRRFEAGGAFSEESNLGRIGPRRREIGVLPYAPYARVVLEVLPDARKVLDERDAEGTQRRLVADTRVHEHLGL